MTAAIQPTSGGGGGGSSGDLADVIETILDKGLVIDAHIAIGVVGIRLVTIDARIVVAGVDTYLRFAEAVNRLDLAQTEKAGIDQLRDGGGKAKDKAKGAAEGVKEKVGRSNGRSDD